MYKSIVIPSIILALIILAGACGPVASNVSPTTTDIPPSPTAVPPTMTPTEVSPTAIPALTEMPVATTTPTIMPTQVSPVDGMVMVYITAGEFEMGNDADDALAKCKEKYSGCNRDWFTNEEPPHTIYLDGYWIDQTEVTNGMYVRCVEASKCDPPANNASSSHESYYGNPSFDNYPVVHVSWHDAVAYCEWAGRRLPTEAEWEKAASWDDVDQQKVTYPWGNAFPSCALVNYWGGCAGDTAGVGSYLRGASPYGALDMAGNAWEWVSSLFKAYPYDAGDGRESLSSLGDRVLRGGSWFSGENSLRSAARHSTSPGEKTHNDVGFRCLSAP